MGRLWTGTIQRQLVSWQCFKMMRRLLVNAWDTLAHVSGKLSKRYYFEDYIRVYPDNIVFNRLGMRKSATRFNRNNYLNHRKFYDFAAQFVRNTVVADIGCGSGYGTAILKEAGAKRAIGADLSRQAVAFARSRYAHLAEFSIQGITDLRLYPNVTIDVTICNEVLEHVKEYGKEDVAISELKRITKPGGIVVLGTPNNELLVDHGFSYREIDCLLSRHFSEYCIFENALVPFGCSRDLWEQRAASRQTGIVVTQDINLAETALLENSGAVMKIGVPPEPCYALGQLKINTGLLHNTHSWVVVATKELS